jgi:O-antigen/teichoic acid export membrane protein
MDAAGQRTEPPRAPAGVRIAEVLRSGQSATAIGLVVNGFAAYVFLAAAGRALGAEDSGQVAVLWATLYTIGTGLFLPLEQELSRSISARRARGEGYGALVAAVARLGAGLCLAIAALLAVLSPVLADSLFRGSYAFVVALVAGVAGVALSFVVRGLMAGSGRYFGYAAYFVVDGLAKALPALVLAVTGVASPLAFAIVAAASAFAGAVAPLTRGLQLGEPGPPAPVRPLLGSMAFLLLTSLLTAVVLNSGTIAVEVLATDAEADAASIFLSGLVIARIPLFMFQAVQAIVLPKLSHSAAADEWAAFRGLMRWLLVGIAGLTVVAVVVSAVLGPWVVELLFGDDFVLSARDMAMLTLASMLMMAAMTINQAQIAIHHQHETGWPWGVGVVAFLVGIALAGDDLLLRVEVGMVAAAASVLVIAGTLLARELRRPERGAAAGQVL